MTSRARWMAAIAALLMATAYWLPLWRVDLIAPQYPEGLGLYISVNGVSGLKEHDLQSINNLNHYIGMKAIVPEAIPELKYMPWILGALIAGGLLVAVLGKRSLLNIWGGALALLLVAGLYDYWRWGYDYGHNLNEETAIIKIPGMSYQPPLIGSKKLLNFRATSWPSGGGIALTLAAGLVALAVFDSRKKRTVLASGSEGTGGEPAGQGPAHSGAAVALILAFSLAGCATMQPRDLALNADECGFCRMIVSDARFGAQVVTTTGRQVVFDSPECLAGFLASTPAESVASVWVLDAQAPGTWIAADEAGFLTDASLRGPMGRVTAFASPELAAAAVSTLGGHTLSWEAIRTDSASIRSAGH